MLSLGKGRFEGISHSLERVKNHISFEKVFCLLCFTKLLKDEGVVPN